jgi:uncharacterized cupin superfamily protein
MTIASAGFNLDSTFLRLRGADLSAEPLPVDATFWPRIMSGKLGTFRNEYLVATSSFDEDWSNWERHPAGDEIVLLLEGAVTFVLETARGERRVALNERADYVVVPRGTWHTAKTATPTRMLFITPGEGTEHRPA